MAAEARKWAKPEWLDRELVEVRRLRASDSLNDDMTSHPDPLARLVRTATWAHHLGERPGRANASMLITLMAYARGAAARCVPEDGEETRQRSEALGVIRHALERMHAHPVSDENLLWGAAEKQIVEENLNHFNEIK